jgi:hypothetical protein
MKTRRGFFGVRGRQAYSLIEVVIASALTSVVLSLTGGTIISTLRVIESSVSDMELALQSRELRDKLLYHINDDGGLMSACQTGLTLVNGSGGSANSITFKPVNGVQNTVSLNASKKLVANLSVNDKWLQGRTIVLQGTNIFTWSATNNIVDVNLDVALPVANRKYVYRHRVKAQIMNNK